MNLLKVLKGYLNETSQEKNSSLLQWKSIDLENHRKTNTLQKQTVYNQRYNEGTKEGQNTNAAITGLCTW